MTGRLTVPEVAAELRCSTKTVRRMIHRGDLPAAYVAGRWLINHGDLPAAGYIRPTPTPPVRPRTPGQPGSLTELVEAMEAA